MDFVRVVFGMFLVIGLYFKFLPFGRSKVESLGMPGYMYCSLFGDFIFLLPILLYRIYRCYKTKTWTFDFIMGMFMISYVMAFLYACYLGQVSPYYYYKNYYLFWAVAFYMVMQTVSTIEKERLDGITVYFLSILALWVFTFGGIESVIEEKVMSMGSRSTMNCTADRCLGYIAGITTLGEKKRFRFNER